VGQLFFDEVTALERTFGLKSGIQSVLADELEIEPYELNEFVRGVLVALERSNNGPLIALTSGCVQIAIALNAEITGEWPQVPQRLGDLLAGSRHVMRAVEAGP
jgi:hypothetical protein